jgi:hypothetical protein
MRKKSTSDLRSGIKKLIGLYASGFKHLEGKEIKVRFGSGCYADIKNNLIELPDVVGYKNQKEKKHKEALLEFGARHEFGHLMSTNLECDARWKKKVKGSRAIKLLHVCMNVFEDIREEHLFVARFPGASESMRNFTQSYIEYEIKDRFYDPKFPITKKLMDLCYLDGRSRQYKSYGLEELYIEIPPDLLKAYKKIAEDLVERAVETRDQDVINEIALEFYNRIKEESEQPPMPPLNVGDVLAKDGEYGQVVSYDPETGDIEVEVIDKSEAKRRLAS